MARKGLGRGLSAILGNEAVPKFGDRTDIASVSDETQADSAEITVAENPDTRVADSQIDAGEAVVGIAGAQDPGAHSDSAQVSGTQMDEAVTRPAGSGKAAPMSTTAGDVSRETLSLSLIEPRKDQPRKHFDEESLQELAESIRQHGILQPILVKKKGRTYEIVVGERRWRAARMAGLSEIPVVIRDMGSREAAEAALIENIQREDLSALEEARAYKTLIDEYSLTQEELARRLSRSRAAVANSMRLLQLPDEVAELIENGSITSGHARAILSVNGKTNRLKAAEEIAAKGLSVRQAEKLAKIYNLRSTDTQSEPVKAVDTEYARYLRAAEEELTRAMNTKVSISRMKNGKGKIEIEYYSDDELGGLIERLR